MDSRLDGNAKALSDEHAKNAKLPIEVTELGRMKGFFPKDEHFANAESPIEVMELGISTEARLVHPSNWFPRRAVWFGASFRIFAATRFTRLIPEGMGIAAPIDRAVIGQPKKASLPISVTELGITTSSGDPPRPSEIQSA
jgi:hypothetical protein